MSSERTLLSVSIEFRENVKVFNDLIEGTKN